MTRPVKFGLSGGRAAGASMLKQALLFLLLPWLAASGADNASTVAVGNLSRKEALVFEGNKTFTNDDILLALTLNFDYHLAAHPAAPLAEYTHTLQRMIGDGYQRGGFPNAKVTVRPDSPAQRLLVQIEEGSRYRCGRVTVTGVKTLNAEVVRRKVTDALGLGEHRKTFGITFGQASWKEGEPAPFDDVARRTLTGQVVGVLEELDSYQPKVNLKVIPVPSEQRADLLIEIADEGRGKVIEQIEVTGVQKNKPDQVLSYLKLKPGVELTGQLVGTISTQLWNSARFLKSDLRFTNLNEPGKLKLVLDLLELEEAPPLNKEFSREAKAMLKLRDWLVQWESRPESMVFHFDAKTGPLTLNGQLIISASGGVVLIKSGASNLLYAAVFSSEVLGFYSPAHRQKLTGSPGDLNLSGFIHVLPSGAPKGESPFNLSIGAGFASDSRGRSGLTLKLAPVAFVPEAHPDILCTVKNGVLTVVEKEQADDPDRVQLKVDAATGRVISLEASGEGISGEVRFEEGAFERAIKEIAAATAEHPNVFAREQPVSSALAFIARDGLAGAMLIGPLAEATEETLRVLALLQKLDLGKLLAPLDPLSDTVTQGVRETRAFSVPEAPPERSSPSEDELFGNLMKSAATLVLQQSDALWPAGSWPWALTREAAFTAGGNSGLTAAQIERLIQADDIGPLGCALWARLLGQRDAPATESLVAHGLAKLTPADFQKDCDRVLRGGCLGGDMLINTLGQLSRLHDEDLGALLAPAKPSAQDSAPLRQAPTDEEAFLRECLQLIRSAGSKPLAEALGPAIEKHWDKVIRPHLQAALERAQDRLGTDFDRQEQLQEAERVAREALAMKKKRLGNENLEVACALYAVAGTLLEQRELPEAEELLRESLVMHRKFGGPDNGCIPAVLSALAMTLDQLGELNDAESMYRETLAVQKKLTPKDPDLVSTLIRLAIVLQKQGRLDDAEALCREALAKSKKLLGKDDEKVGYPRRCLASFLLQRGSLDEAENLYREELALRQNRLGPEHAAVATSLDELAHCLAKRNKWVEAKTLFADALAMREKVLTPGHKDTAWSNDSLARLLATCPSAELRDGRSAVLHAEKAVAATSRENPYMLRTLAAAYAEAGQFEQAVSVQKEAIALLKDEKEKEDFATRLKLYESKQPYHETD